MLFGLNTRNNPWLNSTLNQAAKFVKKLEKQMYTAARELEFEKAAKLRDRIKRLHDKELEIS